jgi:hypothetical protein
MITSKHELEDEIEKLRQKTLPLLWSELAPTPTNSLLSDLEEILKVIRNSKNRKLQNMAVQVIESYVDIDVDCDPTITVSF